MTDQHWVDRVRDFAFSESTEWRMIRTDKFKYVHYLNWELENGPRDSLYDLDKDPNELKDVFQYPDYSAIADEMKNRLQWVMDSTSSAQLNVDWF